MGALNWASIIPRDVISQAANMCIFSSRDVLLKIPSILPEDKRKLCNKQNEPAINFAGALPAYTSVSLGASDTFLHISCTEK